MTGGWRFDGRGGLVLIKRKRGEGGGAAQFVRGNYKSFKGINLTVLERMHLFIIGGREEGGGSSICAWKLYILLRG